jgi:hypothetical protein
MVTSILSSTTSSSIPPPPGIPSHDKEPLDGPGSSGGPSTSGLNGNNNDEASHETTTTANGSDDNNNNNNDDDLVTICMTVFIFRAAPDLYSTRHVLMYFTSPDLPHLHETVHTQRLDEKAADWFVDRRRDRADWATERNYASHVNAGAVRVPRARALLPVEIVAAIPTKGRDGEWNCQHFLYEGLQAIVDRGLQTQGWYDAIEDEMMDKIFDGTVG